MSPFLGPPQEPTATPSQGFQPLPTLVTKVWGLLSCIPVTLTTAGAGKLAGGESKRDQGLCVRLKEEGR